MQRYARLLHTSRPLRAYRARTEDDVRYLIDSLPASNRLFKEADDPPRQPSELELHKLAHLSLLNKKRSLKMWQWFMLSQPEAKLFSNNSKDIAALLPSIANGATGDIVDKIPLEDKDGKIYWEVVRQDTTEGWEWMSYYLMVPALAGLVGIHLFKEDTGIDQWAMDELKLRASNGEKDLHDNQIVERILSGEYDRLLDLKKTSVSP